MDNSYLFTSESVTAGHPDKLCDMIADAVLDAYLELDPYSRVACEVTATTGVIHIMGEITSEAVVDIPSVVRSAIKEAGYTGGDFGFDASTCGIVLSIDRQSNDIDMGVSQKDNAIGAGDQGMMFGYACQETDNYMPAPIFYAHELCKRLNQVRKELPFLGPDGKSMVTFRYKDDIPVSIDTIVVSIQHLAEISQEKIRKSIKEKVIIPVIPEHYLDGNTKILINPTGRFVQGGPCADTGLTGRKIIVDTYGGMGRHGGGAFSGKDPTKVDRTGAYAARYVAKNIVAAKAAKRCEVQIAYAIGVADPVSVHIDTFGTSGVGDRVLEQMIRELFDLRPAALIKGFKLRKPIYRKLAVHGHMGREDLSMAWEKTDKLGQIQNYLADKA